MSIINIMNYYYININLYVLHENMFSVRGSFITESYSTPAYIRNVLQNNGPVGIFVHMESTFCALTDISKTIRFIYTYSIYIHI